MRTQLRQCSLLMAAVAVLGPVFSIAQVTEYQEQQWLNTPAAASQVGHLTGRAKAAAMDYRRYCLVCHGALGDGNGESAQWLDPKPRDFTLAVFKCRSTPTGTLPTDEDLFNTIARGLDRSNMPPWNTFTTQQRADLVAWIKHYSGRWQTEKPGTPIQIPSEPEVTADRVKAGQEVFNRVQCWKCHGVEGQWPLRFHSARRPWPSHSALQLRRGWPVQVRKHRPGSLPHFHDGPGWHAHAFVCRQHQARGGLGPGVLFAFASAISVESQGTGETAGIEAGQSESRPVTKRNEFEQVGECP
jgi:mono/diheme cytochrome c family protein